MKPKINPEIPITQRAIIITKEKYINAIDTL
jgi:hypothetical protein